MRKSGAGVLLAVMAILTLGADSALAQHTVVKKNGVGGRIETDYNAADKAIEMRTIGPDGKVEQKVNYEYLPGYHVPQQTDTTYWPNGQLRKVSRHTYDENANFTGEFIQTFDEGGKQIAGHKLTHDPWKGTYRCAEWNASAQDYRAVACPAGEEEGGGGAQELTKFTYDEVMKNLDAARKNAARDKERSGGEKGEGAGREAAALAAKFEAGIVLPAQFRRGERISGRVVEDPDHYVDMREVTVTRIRVPFEAGGGGSQLRGWLVEVAGEKPRRADGPITLVVPGNGPLTIMLRQADNPAHFVSHTLNLPDEPAKKSTGTHSFEADALCMKGALCAVRGPFGGDSSRTFAAFEDRPAAIVAETSDAVYLSIPQQTEAGPRPLFISEESAGQAKVVALPVVVGQFFIRNNAREVQAGETMITFPTLEGPSGLQDAAWQGNRFPAASFERARQLIPGFELGGPKCEAHEREESEEKREAEEKENAREKDGEDDMREKESEGRILVVLKNLAPEQTSLHSSRDETVVFCLGDEAFQRGDFKYDLRVDARKAGKIDVRGYVIPFLAPVAGQEFGVKPAP